MKKIKIQSLYSVSEYILNLNKTITENRFLSTNKEKTYIHRKDDLSYKSIIKLFDSKTK